MPRWIYNRPPDQCDATELRLAKLLNERLPDEWIVRWGFWYADNQGTLREGDFLVLGPVGGVAVFEVKSSVHRVPASGSWDAGDNPLFQLMAEHCGVLRRLREVAANRNLPLVAKALVLPASEIATGISEYAGLPREVIVAANELRDFDAVWRRLFANARPVTPEQRAVFMAAYGEDLEPKTMKAFISETDRLMLRQTTANYAVLDMLAGNRQLVVEGGVGTGKSWYAIEQAKRFAENAGEAAGREVLMVAYNLALCERLRAGVQKLKLARGSIQVRSAESLAADMLKAAGIPHEVPTNQADTQRYFDEVLPLLAIEALTTERDKLGHLLGKFDALVVDEAQDHDTSIPGASSHADHTGWWTIYMALLKDGWQAPIAIFGDAAQRPPFRAQDRFEFHTLRQRLAQHAHLRLHQALRYTRQVYQFLRSLEGEGTGALLATLRCDGPLPGGPEVWQRDCDAAQIPGVIEAILNEWQQSGLCTPAKVLILYDRSQMDKTALAGLTMLGGHTLRPFLATLDDPQPQCIGHSSIHKAKGLDSLAVILVGLRPFDQLTSAYDRFTYFMGASRARQLLACVHGR